MVEKGHHIGTCGCQACLAVRRVHSVLTQEGLADSIRAYGLGKLREFYCELLDRVEGAGPVAAGSTPGAVGDQATPAGQEELVLPRVPTPPRRSRAREPSAKEREEKRSPPPAKKEKKGERKEKEKKARKEKKDKSSRHQGSESQRDRTTKNTPEKREESPERREKKDRSESSEPKKKAHRTREREAEASPVPTRVKEEVDYQEGPVASVREVSLSSAGEDKGTPEKSPEEEDRARSSGLHRRDSRDSHPEESEGVRLRGRAPERRRSRTRSRRGRSRTPDRKRGRAPSRPRTPSRPPPPRWPQPPPGPPPGWFNYPSWNFWGPSSRSKGVQRRVRNADIRTFGADPGRKSERVQHQYSSGRR